jgi:hypothetical protein
MRSASIIDRGVWNWFPAAALFIFGVVLLAISARMFGTLRSPAGEPRLG